MIILTKEHLDDILSHAKEGYPHEVCGIILGKYDGDGKKAEEVRRAKNLNTERANDRYEIDPKDLLGAEREGRDKGYEVVGFYHSHPDHPDAPSEFDRERAWPCYSYIIVSVRGGEEVSFRSWLLNDETKSFDEEKIIISGE